MTSTLPLRSLLPARADEPPLADPTQQAFRETLREVDALRERLLALRNSQAAARQTYWRQVGPLAATTVTARRALYAPLEEALLGGYLSRAETQQVTELLLAIAYDLEARFGEEESELIARYAPPPRPTEEEDLATPEPAMPTPSAPHVATARPRRQQRTQAAEQAGTTAAEALLGSTKAAYRALARRFHPDRMALAEPAAQQAQTAQMQRVTAAYAAQDLAALLGLLAEEATTPAPEVDAELLRRYVRALAQQRTTLAQQVARAQATTSDQPWSGTEKQQRTRLRETKRSLRAELDYLQQVLRAFQDPAELRRWLRAAASQSQAGV